MYKTGHFKFKRERERVPFGILPPILIYLNLRTSPLYILCTHRVFTKFRVPKSNNVYTDGAAKQTQFTLSKHFGS